MKSNKLFLSLFLTAMMCVPVSMSAQVTIGGGTPPQHGATLDLNADFTGGLLLPNVEITDLGAIPYTFTSAEVQGANTRLELAGLVVYNTNLNPAASIFRGIYYWDGENWHLLAIDGGFMTIDRDATLLVDCDHDGVLTTGPVQISNSALGIAGEYLFTIVAGDSYASVEVIDENAGIFTVNFQPNTTANIRNAVIMVTDPAGRTAIFIFRQDGCPCDQPEVTVTVGTHGTNILCQDGSVHAFIASVSHGSIADHTYYWVRNGIVVAEGAGAELRQIGTYRVYANMIGCGDPALVGTITVLPSNETAEQPPHIIVSNNGILCGSNPVTLSALGVVDATGLRWLRNGLLHLPGNNQSSITVSGAEHAGEWYAIRVDSDCSSVASNRITLAFTENVGTLPEPEPRVNGLPFTASASELIICAGGTLKLSIYNAAAYSNYSNVMFEWFGNGESLGRTTASTMFVVPPSFTHLVISVTVTASGECPRSVTSNEFTVISGQTPVATSINAGAQRAYICATHPAILTAGAIGSEYQWFRNGVELTYTTQTIQVMQPGTYTVRYANAAGCWSTISPPIEVLQSAPVTMLWLLAPGSEEIFESSRTLSVAVAPDATSIEWSVVDPNHASLVSFMPLGIGNMAVVTFGAGTGTVSNVVIRVRATNACGTAELLSAPFTVEEGCIPVSSLVITPNTPQTIQEGQSITFTASANVGSEPITYAWFVNGITVASTSENIFVFTPAAAGEYLIRVEARNPCTTEGTGWIPSISVPVTVTIDPRNLGRAPDANQPHFHSGRTCLDVRQTGGAATDNPWVDGGRLPLNMRPNDFNNGNQLTFAFPFSTTGGNNIRFFVDDPQNIVQSVSGDVNSATATASVTFNPNIVTMATGTTNNTALAFTLFAVFTVGGIDYQENITIRVQDQVCGCPAQVGGGQWRLFRCHNSGADTNVNPFTGTRAQLRGNYYMWGHGRTPVVDRNLNILRTIPPNNPSPATWTTWQDPCEPGWRVAEEAIWSAVWGNNSRSRTNSGTFIQLGQYLRLPAQGFRNQLGVSYFDGPRFDYWTRTPAGGLLRRNFFDHGATTTPGWTTMRGDINWRYQEPVRCVQVGNPH